MHHLLFIKDGQTLLQRPLDRQELLIGRDRHCDIQMTDPEISREHCVLKQENHFWILKDLSRNGTFVNGRKILQGRLNSADEVQIGPWLFKLVQEAATTTEETLVRDLPVLTQNENALGPMLGSSRAMKTVFEMIRKAAPSDITVCLVGESGTGKELAATLLHRLSPRVAKPFVPVNCGAIPENLIESLLFGHEKGSFTGATERQTGVFEEANGGTLFLDEIGEMPLDLQTRLLRVLEEKALRRIGGKSDIPVDVRLITATNRDLKQAVSRETFRKDLFYRLYIFPIYIAPLRERAEEILPLAEHFLKCLAPHDKPFSFSEGAREKLLRHEWSGNVRELKNVIQRALLLSRGGCIEADEIELTTLPENPLERGELKLGEQEKLSILEALRKFKGNFTQTAKHLGIARTTLASKLKRYQIDPKECG